MGFRLDVTTLSVVVVCDQCPWRGLTLDRVEGWRAARTHERRTHPGDATAARALYAAEHRG